MINVNTLIDNWFSIIFDYAASLAQYEIVEGVNFFGVLIAIGVFSIIGRYFFSKIQGAG